MTIEGSQDGTPASRPRSARPRAPISLQLVALLMLCLLAAQLIAIVTILLTPPPRPQIYRLSEIAHALRGGPLDTRLGRPLTRETARDVPPELRRALQNMVTVALADLVDAAPRDVLIAQHPPSPFFRLIRQLRGNPNGAPRWRRPPEPGAGGPPHGPPDGFRPGGPPLDARPPAAPQGGPPGADGEGPMAGGIMGDVARPPPGAQLRVLRGRGVEPALMGDFTAAVRQADGAWLVVRAAPEPFPTDWQKRIALWLFGGFLVVAPAAYLFARRITAPLKRFAEAAETLGRDPMAPQITLSGPAEVGSAARAFNEMQDRLKRYISDRTAMVGAISHDLRTPLARIRFKLEAAPQPLKESILGDVAQMEQMIGGVLAFIRDEGEPRRRERLDLLSVVEVAADDAALVGGDVEIVSAEPVEVMGDPSALQRLFANLVQNAIKYGRQARITVRREDGHAVVEITDAGPGLSSDDLERVFQPFYRADLSRNLDEGGVGLGLAIARSTARGHGGDVKLKSRAQGLTATVTLPLAP